MAEKLSETCKGCPKAISRREIMRFSEHIYAEGGIKIQIIPNIIRKYKKCRNCKAFPDTIKFIMEWI